MHVGRQSQSRLRAKAKKATLPTCRMKYFISVFQDIVLEKTKNCSSGTKVAYLEMSLITMVSIWTDKRQQPPIILNLSKKNAMKSLFSPNINLTEKVLDLRLQRQNLVASNLANIDTPGYRERRIEFENQLQEALRTNGKGQMTRTAQGHLPTTFDPDSFEGTLDKDMNGQIVQGKDSVDLDKEMSVMAKNTLLYNAMATVLKKNFEGLKTTIQEASR